MSTIVHAFCAQCPIKCHQEQQLVVSLSIGDHVHYIALPKPACVSNAQCAMCILCNNQMSLTVANISPSVHPIVTTCNKLCCHWCQCATAALGAAQATLLNLAVLWCVQLKWIFCFSFLVIVSTNTELKWALHLYLLVGSRACYNVESTILDSLEFKSTTLDGLFQNYTNQW